jgi:uncharacterized membrane protein
MWAKKRSTRAASYGMGVAAVLATAAAAFLLDPESGGRRRALIRDRAIGIGENSRKFLRKAGKDAQQRTAGTMRGVVSRLRGRPVDDRALAARVRSKLGRLTSHPGAIDVTCRQGVVQLRGDILLGEIEPVLDGVRRVAGVVDIVSELRSHVRADHVPALQGLGTGGGWRFEYFQENWSPAARTLAGTAAAAMVVGGMARRGLAGYGAAAGGVALLARSVCNVSLSRLLGARSSPSDGVLVQKTLEVYADIGEVYSRWRRLEDLPRFMTHVREVRKLDDARYRWIVDGPAGSTTEWESVITAEVPNELIAWRTVEGSTVQSSGVVQFEPTAYGGTRIHVRMTYRPPANALGHAVAKLFGRDAKRQIDDDLLRFKRFVETGVPSRDARGSLIH